MSEHVPMCPVCNENEVGSLAGGTEYYCSSTCNSIAFEEASAYTEEFRAEYYDDYSDDAEAFASAGWGTDEDYGGSYDITDWYPDE